MANKRQLLLTGLLALSAHLYARGGGEAFAGSLGGSLMGSVIGNAMTSGNRNESRGGGGGESSSRRLDKISRRIDDLNEAMSTVRSDFGNDLRELKAQIASVQSSVKSFEKRLQDCEQSVKKLQNKNNGENKQRNVAQVDAIECKSGFVDPNGVAIPVQEEVFD
jgi:hypothetical protein